MDVLREYYPIYGTYTCNRCKLIRWRTHTTTQCNVFSSNGIRPFPLSNKGVCTDYVLLLDNKDIFSYYRREGRLVRQLSDAPQSFSVKFSNRKINCARH